jgi:hypothetical protein
MAYIRPAFQWIVHSTCHPCLLVFTLLALWYWIWRPYGHTKHQVFSELHGVRPRLILLLLLAP